MREKRSQKRRLGGLGGLALAALLGSPTAAFAGFDLTINPERLDGIFEFADKDQGENNITVFFMNGEELGIAGAVTGNAGGDLVSINYSTPFPTKTSGSEQSGSIAQDRQVLMSVEVEPGIGSPTPAYFGRAAPVKCKVQGKLRDAESADPDDPDKAQVKLSCDLGNDMHELDTDDDPNTPGDPPQAVLDAIAAAFDARKDVKVKTGQGTVQIKHNGEPLAP
jgi:hypothetical protein